MKDPKWASLLSSDRAPNSALSYQSRALQRVTINVGQKMHAMRSLMQRNEEQYERLTNARSTQDIIQFQNKHQKHHVEKWMKNVPTNLLQRYELQSARNRRSKNKSTLGQAKRRSLSRLTKDSNGSCSQLRTLEEPNQHRHLQSSPQFKDMKKGKRRNIRILDADKVNNSVSYAYRTDALRSNPDYLLELNDSRPNTQQLSYVTYAGDQRAALQTLDPANPYQPPQRQSLKKRLINKNTRNEMAQADRLAQSYDFQQKTALCHTEDSIITQNSGGMMIGEKNFRRKGLKQNKNSLARSSVKIRLNGRKSKVDAKNISDFDQPKKSVAKSIAEQMKTLAKSNTKSKSVLPYEIQNHTLRPILMTSSSKHSLRKNPSTLGRAVTADSFKHVQSPGSIKYVPLSAFQLNGDGNARKKRDYSSILPQQISESHEDGMTLIKENFISNISPALQPLKTAQMTPVAQNNYLSVAITQKSISSHKKQIARKRDPQTGKLLKMKSVKRKTSPRLEFIYPSDVVEYMRPQIQPLQVIQQRNQQLPPRCGKRIKSSAKYMQKFFHEESSRPEYSQEVNQSVQKEQSSTGETIQIQQRPQTVLEKVKEKLNKSKGKRAFTSIDESSSQNICGYGQEISSQASIEQAQAAKVRVHQNIEVNVDEENSQFTLMDQGKSIKTLLQQTSQPDGIGAVDKIVSGGHEQSMSSSSIQQIEKIDVPMRANPNPPVNVVSKHNSGMSQGPHSDRIKLGKATQIKTNASQKLIPIINPAMSDSMLIDREISNGADVSVTASHQHQSLKIHSEKSSEVFGASATDMQ